MLAKLASLRESDKSFTSISIEARHYKCMPDPETTISMHADEACVIHEPDFHAAESAILEELYGNAMRRAAGALDLLSKQAKTPKAKTTLTGLRDELRRAE